MSCQVDGCYGECETHNPTSGETIFRFGWASEADILFHNLNTAYEKLCVNGIEPNLMVVSPETYKKIKTMFQSQQVFSGSEPPIGFSGMKFYNTTIVVSKDSADDKVVGSNGLIYNITA